MLDRSLGCVQVLNGRVYYSPNSCRVVREPVADVFGENPFVPPIREVKHTDSTANSTKRNVMDLDISSYMLPRWWNSPWGWISFFPHNPDYRQPPFDTLLLNLRRCLRLPDDSGYSMPNVMADSWLTLDSDLTTITSLLQVYFDIPAIRPMNPRAFGFHKHFRYQRVVAKVINKSREWFSVWVALLSFLIARAESKEIELRPFPHLAKQSWYNFLLGKGVERTWLDSLASSVACSFRPDITRTGIFLHLPAKDIFQPSIEWFCQYGVPVWYAWGKEQAQDHRFSSYAPLTHQLQLGTTTLLRNPSTSESVAVDVVAPNSSENPSTDESVAVDAAAPGSSEDLSTEEFFASRVALNRRLEMTETASEKQKRLSRERKPPTQSAKVFRWVKDLTSDRYIREQVSKKWRQDTLGDYSSKQARYDSFSNEWDCSSQFGPDDEPDDEEPGADDEVYVEYNEGSDIDSDTPVLPVSSNVDLVSIEHEQEWLPFPSIPHSIDMQETEAILEEELLEAANLHFGYTAPLPVPSLPPLTDLSRQKAFLRFFGFSWAQSRASLFCRPQVLALVNFISRLSSNGAISNDDWDLSRENRSYVAFTERFRHIKEVSGPNGPLFMIDFGENATVKWTLTLTTAADALFVCRLHPKLQEKDLALYLLRRAVPFYTLQEANTLHSVQCGEQLHSRHPHRPANHMFTIRDYAAYVEQCEVIFGQRRSRAALLRGGYLWRVSVTSVSFDNVLNGPSGRSLNQDEMFVVTLPNGTQLVDDTLTESEVLLLSGMYNCLTGNANQISLKSWCPLSSIFSGSGIDFGRWTPYNESLYTIACSDVKAPDPILRRQPCASGQWRNICRGTRELTRARIRTEQVALSLIRDLHSS